MSKLTDYAKTQMWFNIRGGEVGLDYDTSDGTVMINLKKGTNIRRFLYPTKFNFPSEPQARGFLLSQAGSFSEEFGVNEVSISLDHRETDRIDYKESLVV